MFQEDSHDLNLEELCDEITGKESIDRVMGLWRKTNSPIAYWTRQMVDMSMKSSLGSEDLPFLEESLQKTKNIFKYGLPLSEINTVCKQMYKNDIVKLTLQIIAPQGMQIKRDLRVTLADQIGVIGM